MKLFKSKRRVLVWIGVLSLIVLIGIASLFLVYHLVSVSAKSRLYFDIEDVPHKKAAVVLGTIKYIQGRENLYYNFRIDAAEQLWKAGKIDAIVVSGDNSRKGYDEPTDMKNDLVSRGVPDEHIAIDYAGFRTLDSVVRAKEVFGLDDYIVVSQKFHCQRAIFLASAKSQNVIGFGAAGVSGRPAQKMMIREALARVKAVLDVIIAKKPKYLGQRQIVNFRNNIDNLEKK